MLEKLALKHSLWAKMAKGICKDAYLADDLVSEMYLKFSEYDKDKEVNEFYVYYAIKHLYINWLRSEKKTNEIDVFLFLEDNNAECKISHYHRIKNTYKNLCEDVSKSYEEIDIELPDCISWVEKQILVLRQQYSCRNIATQYHLNPNKVNRIELKAKEKLKEWAKEKYKELVTQ